MLTFVAINRSSVKKFLRITGIVLGCLVLAFGLFLGILTLTDYDPPRRQFRRSWRLQIHPNARTRYLALYAMDKQTEAGRAAFLARVDRAMRAF